jgi:hypothetical protein
LERKLFYIAFDNGILVVLLLVLVFITKVYGRECECECVYVFSVLFSLYLWGLRPTCRQIRLIICKAFHWGSVLVFELPNMPLKSSKGEI